MNQKRLAAFIITFERSEILPKTIAKVFSQTLPPEKILIIDNSISDKTEKLAPTLGPSVGYYRMGYNSGPAGGARKGLELLAKEGYQWIFWGDDDDPPPSDDCLEKLVGLAETYKGRCGQVGIVGHRFNKVTGTFVRTTNEELLNSQYLEVDSIGGGMCKVVNGEAIRAGVLPEEKLFFGFEDLDFDLATKRAGYEIIVHSKMFLTSRERANRMNYKHVPLRKKDVNRLWREYYSIRNSLYIMKKNRLYLALLSTMAISIGKSVLGYKHGLKYGNLLSGVTFRAIRDYSLGRYHMRT